MKHIVILGSTGSIGTQTLAVLAAFPDKFRVIGLSGYRNMTRLAQQICQVAPDTVAVPDMARAQLLREELNRLNYRRSLSILTHSHCLEELAVSEEINTLVVGVVGFCGLAPTLAALKNGTQVLTANKETFVTAGHLVKPYLSQIIPLDSEHSAIFQCLQGNTSRRNIHKLYLTASGGPFRQWSAAQMKEATPSQALAHPNWSMGAKVTVDSATLMNKGLETLEAQHLFGVTLDRVDVVVHPQSIVHSAVAFRDGAILAQLGQPDMRLPIQYGLTYPERWAATHPEMHLDLTTLAGLDFEPADTTRFPALPLARWAGDMGGTFPVVLNAADELAVQAFLDGVIGFTDIVPQVEAMLHRHAPDWCAAPDLDTIVAVDAWTRENFPYSSSIQPQQPVAGVAG